MGKQSARDRTALACLDALYATLPDLRCRKQCAEACGPIVLTDLEARRLQQTAHSKPRTIPLQVEGRARERCIYLTDRGRCRVYDQRPLICRVYGLVKMLSCPHGCVPERWISNLEFVRLAQDIERIGGGRILRTTPRGLVHYDGESFGTLPRPTRSEAALADDEDRTRGLRAIFGGRIIAAVDSTKG